MLVMSAMFDVPIAPDTASLDSHENSEPARSGERANSVKSGAPT
jgi:hypothetical protein